MRLREAPGLLGASLCLMWPKTLGSLGEESSSSVIVGSVTPASEFSRSYLPMRTPYLTPSVLLTGTYPLWASAG